MHHIQNVYQNLLNSLQELESSLKRRLLLLGEQRFQGKIQAGVLITKMETKESIPGDDIIHKKTEMKK